MESNGGPGLSPTSGQKHRGSSHENILLAEREALSLALLLDRPATFETGLLLVQLHPLPLQLVLHLAVPRVEFVLALFQLALLLGHLLLEDHLHLGLHLGELLLVQGALLLLLDRRVDLLEHAGVLGDTHLGELVGAVVLVEGVVGVLLELLHVGADQHLAQLDEVAVLLVVDLDHAPGVATTADFTAVGRCHLRVGANDGEGDLGHDLLVLGDGLLVIQLVARTLEDLDGVVLDIGKDLERINVSMVLQKDG